MTTPPIIPGQTTPQVVYVQPTPPPERRPSWIAPTIIALAVLVAASLGLAGWALTRDQGPATPAAAPTTSPAAAKTPFEPAVACTIAVPALTTVTDQMVHYLRGEPVNATALNDALNLIRPIMDAPPSQMANQLQALLEIGDRVVSETRAGTHGVINSELYRSSGVFIAQFCLVYAR